MTVVKFTQDVSPYCKGDVVELTAEEKKRVDEAAKARALKDAYSEVKAEKKSAPSK